VTDKRKQNIWLDTGDTSNLASITGSLDIEEDYDRFVDLMPEFVGEENDIVYREERKVDFEESEEDTE